MVDAQDIYRLHSVDVVPQLWLLQCVCSPGLRGLCECWPGDSSSVYPQAILVLIP